MPRAKKSPLAAHQEGVVLKAGGSSSLLVHADRQPARRPPSAKNLTLRLQPRQPKQRKGSVSSSCSSSASSLASSSQMPAHPVEGTTSGGRGAAPVERRKRLAANARERKRMHLLNEAYDQLRQRLNDAHNKSKYDVLVQAKEYIRELAGLLGASPTPLLMTSDAVQRRTEVDTPTTTTIKLEQDVFEHNKTVHFGRDSPGQESPSDLSLTTYHNHHNQCPQRVNSVQAPPPLPLQQQLSHIEQTHAHLLAYTSVQCHWKPSASPAEAPYSPGSEWSPQSEARYLESPYNHHHEHQYNQHHMQIHNHQPPAMSM